MEYSLREGTGKRLMRDIFLYVNKEVSPMSHAPRRLRLRQWFSTFIFVHGTLSYVPVSYTHLDVYKRQILLVLS